jgi:YHS domain-containing protein
MLVAVAISCKKPSGEVYVTDNGAINGYDPVAYFHERKALKGRKEFTIEWKDAAWYFSSAENKKAFQKDPGRYLPQYGGYCAYGTADGHKAPTDPDAWTIVNGKLYLNYNVDVKKAWLKDQNTLILKADSLWPSVRNMD